MKLGTIALMVALAAGARHAFADTEIAERAVTGTVTVVNIPWSFPNGKIDWKFNPTSKKGPFNPEWTWQLNRMGFWNDMAKAYQATKDERYAKAFARQLTDWLDQTGGIPPEADYNVVGSTWRTIEEGLRLMGSWKNAWRTFSPSLPAALRERFKASAYAQAKHLLRHYTAGNWLMMEMNGVYAFASEFTDLPDSAEMRQKSAKLLSDALQEQVLPDGHQYELSPDYHSVCLNCAAQMYTTARTAGKTAELSPDFIALLRRMAEATIALTTPSLVQPRFNDCYTLTAKKTIAAICPCFPEREDFAWIISDRASGKPPEGETASRCLPWAGFAAMRSDWSPDASYLCFDFGSLGKAHIHQDKLSFTLWKGGEELIYDDGGGQYEDSSERYYATSGYGHNTLLVDGLAQEREEPLMLDAPADAGWQSSPSRDYAVGVYDQGFGPKMLNLAKHKREIAFDKVADSFTITDTIVSVDGKSHDYTLLLQLDTTNTVISANGTHLLADYGRRWNLSVEVKGGKIKTAVGQRSPRLAGWFVGRNDLTVHPATTVSIQLPRGKNRTAVIRLKALPRRP